MPNDEMMRPFNMPTELGGKLRDALTFNTVEIRLKVNTKDTYILEVTWAKYGKMIGRDEAITQSYGEAHRIQSLFLDALYVARNAPVLATEQVLAGLPKDAKIWVVIEEGDRKAKYKATYKYMRYDTDPIWEYTPYDCSVCEDDGYEYPSEVYTDSGCYLVADKDDPKTAEYLRQFTRQGVRKETKDV